MSVLNPLNADSSVKSSAPAKETPALMRPSRRSAVTPRRIGTGAGTRSTSIAPQNVNSTPAAPPRAMSTTLSAASLRARRTRDAPSA
jgi:hypothetical protein